MHLIDDTPTRLVLGQNRPVLAVTMLISTALSMFMLVNLVVQTIQRADIFTGAQWVAFGVWALLAVGLIALGVWTLNSGLRGVRLTLDRETEVVTLRRPYRLGLRVQQFPIYSVSGLEVVHNPDINIYALMLVLRSGERLPLGTGSPYTEQALRQLARHVREFLNQQYRPVIDKLQT